MKRDYGDMYQYILESKKAVRNIISNHEEIFHDAIEYFFNGNYEQIYVIGSGTSYHAALAAKNLMEKVLQMKVFASYPIVFKDERILSLPAVGDRCFYLFRIILKMVFQLFGLLFLLR